MLNSILKPLTIPLAFALFAAPAAAATLGTVGSSIFGSNGSTTLSITDDDLRPTGAGVVAGGFQVKVTNGALGDAALDLAASFTAWCLDIGINVAFPSDYQVTTNPFVPTFNLSTTQKADILRMAHFGYNPALLGDAAYSAAFQLALWEIVNEDSGVYNINSGSFFSTGGNGTATTARTQANIFLGAATNFVGSTSNPWRVIYLESQDTRSPAGRDSQHLMTVAAVPLPAAAGLLLLALGGLGVVAGRRRTA